MNTSLEPAKIAGLLPVSTIKLTGRLTGYGIYRSEADTEHAVWCDSVAELRLHAKRCYTGPWVIRDWQGNIVARAQ